ncbi:hypothetical protein E4T44_08521 [Aureobasidium sp. EXF-8845]|nr:hypothetical protein E4T44_08521 [Aureobasidium sp. EXF-8845]KAI4855070.1 hypothetical protein E4T45_03496 [Aureobasidium sp. EXF-8846]
MSPPRELYRLTMDMGNDDTNRRIAEFRRNLQTYEEISSQNRSSDPESGYRTATPEPTAFIADPDSPHLAPSPHLRPNITTRGHKRSGRRFSDLFTISHRGRNTPTPTFDQDNRPKISRPIVDQGEIRVPHNGPYIYNHPSRPRLDVEIPRSSFSDLWGQRYGPIGDAGYNVDAVQHDVRNTQSVDFGRLVGGRENYRHDTRRHGVSLGGIADWNTFVATNSTTGSIVDSDCENAVEDDDMDASYLAPLVSPTLHSPSSSITTASASLPSISNLPPLPPSTSDLPPLPPSTVALDEDNNPAPTLEEDHTRSPSPLTREPSERWIRHPLRQNPPTRTFLPSPPPPPPSSPILFPSTPSPAINWPSLQHFRPSCGVLIANIGTTAMVQPFIVNPDYEHDEMSFAESSEGSIVQVREDTSPPVARRLFGNGGSGSASAAHSTAQSRRRRGSGGLRSLCCGLLPSRHRRRPQTADVSITVTSTPLFPSMTQRVPVIHTTIPEEDEDEEENNDQENQPPTILDTLVQINEHDDEHNNDISNQAEQEADQEMVEEHEAGRRRSVRHSWVTVSRWLE